MSLESAAPMMAFEHAFPDEVSCWEFLEAHRWPRGPVCPDCEAVDEAARCRDGRRRWRCRACGGRFHAAQGTAIGRSHLPLLKWFAAIYVLSAAPGLPATWLGVAFGIRQKTAWSLRRRVRRMAEEDAALHRAIAAAPLAGRDDR